jgi:predicted ATPase
MIRQWYLANFKSVGDELRLELAPLTIIAGANSSGKSTVLQSLLLVTQTLGSKLASRPVVLNGPLVRLGTFNEIRNFAIASPEIKIGWTITPDTVAPEDFLSSRDLLYRLRPLAPGRASRLTDVQCELRFDVDSADEENPLTQLQPRLQFCTVSAEIKDRGTVTARPTVTIERSEQAPAERGRSLHLGYSEESPILRSLEYCIQLDTESQQYSRDRKVIGEPVGARLSHFLPERIVYRVDTGREAAEWVTATVCGEEEAVRSLPPRIRRDSSTIPTRVLTSVRRILQKERDDLSIKLGLDDLPNPRSKGKPSQSISIDMWQHRLSTLAHNDRIDFQSILERSRSVIHKVVLAESTTQYALHYIRIPLIDDIVSYIDSFFASAIRYLGPLRDEPKAIYQLASSADQLDVGLRGENTAAVLHLNQLEPINYIPPARFEANRIDSRAIRSSLIEGVKNWLRYLGVAHDVFTEDRGRMGHELRVTTSDADRFHDLTHVGVGVSQVLPIVVMCLLTCRESNTYRPREAVLLLEQPELHLHPKVQARLGDFFMAMALQGKQCIVETHSEYLVNRIRRRIAESNDEVLAEKTKIYFVEKAGVQANWRSVNITKYGAIEDWPEEFFDQSQLETERILTAGARKRRREREAGDAVRRD